MRFDDRPRRLLAIFVICLPIVLLVPSILGPFWWPLCTRAIKLMPSRVAGNWTEVWFCVGIFTVSQVLRLWLLGWPEMKWKESIGIGVLSAAIGWSALFCWSLLLEMRDIWKVASRIEVPKAHAPRVPLDWDRDRETRRAQNLGATVSGEQLQEIRQLDAIFSGLDETALRKFFGFDEMVYLNMKMYQARIKHFTETGDRGFDIGPYVQGQDILLDTSIAGEHLHHEPGGGGYDFDPSQIAIIVLPRKYSDNKKILIHYENSALLPTSVVVRVNDFDSTLGENATQLIRVMDASLNDSPNYFLYYDVPVETQYRHAVESRYWREFKSLRAKADQIRDACRSFLDVP